MCPGRAEAILALFICIVRVLATVFSAVGAALYIAIWHKVTDDTFPATGIGLTSLPLIGAAISVAWNVICLATTKKNFFLGYMIADLVLAISLTVMGSVGFHHDNVTYLKTGLWKQYSTGPWLRQEISGFVLIIISVALQLVIALGKCFEWRNAVGIAKNGMWSCETGARMTDEEMLNYGYKRGRKGLFVQMSSHECTEHWEVRRTEEGKAPYRGPSGSVVLGDAKTMMELDCMSIMSESSDTSGWTKVNKKPKYVKDPNGLGYIKIPSQNQSAED